MRKRIIHRSSNEEINYIQALSRESTIKAYANWIELSDAESQCLSIFLKKNARVLDLGCGTGRIAKIIGSNLEYYLGIDLSPEMIKVARILNPDFKFLCEDILEPSYNERNFDAILLMNNVVDMLHPVERRRNIFIQLKDFIEPSGVVIFSSHLLNNAKVPGYYKEDYHGALVSTYRSSFSQLCEEVESYGFEVKMALRDYRSTSADWAYIVAKTKNNI